jgi:hypothetical protein
MREGEVAPQCVQGGNQSDARRAARAWEPRRASPVLDLHNSTGTQRRWDFILNLLRDALLSY